MRRKTGHVRQKDGDARFHHRTRCLLYTSHQTLKRYLLEEAYEVFDAIDKEDMFELADELGDVLLQVVFHGQIGQEYSEFTHQDVVTNIFRQMLVTTSW